MNQLTPKEKYVFTFPQDENGEDLKFRFMLTLSKRMDDSIGDPSGDETVNSRLQKAIGTLDGIDAIQLQGRYTVECAIARTFDPDEVITELKLRLESDVLSDIIKPTLVV